MRKSRTLLDRYSLEKSYISFIRPLMEYTDVIWDNQKQNLINKLENIKLNAVRIVTGGDQINITWQLVWRNKMGETKR